MLWLIGVNIPSSLQNHLIMTKRALQCEKETPPSGVNTWPYDRLCIFSRSAYPQFQLCVVCVMFIKYFTSVTAYSFSLDIGFACESFLLVVAELKPHTKTKTWTNKTNNRKGSVGKLHMRASFNWHFHTLICHCDVVSFDRENLTLTSSYAENEDQKTQQTRVCWQLILWTCGKRNDHKAAS